MDFELLTKSLPLQIAIGSGYLGYLAAYSGVRAHHQPTDVAFLTIAFGLVATMTASVVSPWVSVAPAIVACAVASVAVGVLWRVVGKGLVRWGLRTAHVNFADDDPSVMTTIASDRRHNVSQVQITVDDGRVLICDNTGKFRDAPIAPFIYGADGSVALYVTQTKRMLEDGTKKVTDFSSVRDEKWGDMMTIVPADKVQLVELRFQPKWPSRRGLAEVAYPSPSSGLQEQHSTTDQVHSSLGVVAPKSSGPNPL